MASFMKSIVLDRVTGGESYRTRSVVATLIEGTIRFLQFVFGIAVIGLYAQDVHRTQKKGGSQDSKWIYATVVGSLSAIVALVYVLVPHILARPTSRARRQLPMFAIDSVFVILWLTQFGMFAKIFITADHKRMRRAVFVDLVNLVFWMITATWCGIRWWKGSNSQQGREKSIDDGESMA
ncbi:hypothetical protein FQN57_007190 [Myotisia sp. PD_48]|nr:hypothetical protein FQN57_007190 [Myotisia sp. PD_48]